MSLLLAGGHLEDELTLKSWMQKLKKQEAQTDKQEVGEGNHEWVTLWLTLWHPGFTPIFEDLWPGTAYGIRDLFQVKTNCNVWVGFVLRG